MVRLASRRSRDRKARIRASGEGIFGRLRGESAVWCWHVAYGVGFAWLGVVVGSVVGCCCAWVAVGVEVGVDFGGAGEGGEAVDWFGGVVVVRITVPWIGKAVASGIGFGRFGEPFRRFV